MNQNLQVICDYIEKENPRIKMRMDFFSSKKKEAEDDESWCEIVHQIQAMHIMAGLSREHRQHILLCDHSEMTLDELVQSCQGWQAAKRINEGYEGGGQTDR